MMRTSKTCEWVRTEQAHLKLADRKSRVFKVFKVFKAWRQSQTIVGDICKVGPFNPLSWFLGGRKRLIAQVQRNRGALSSSGAPVDIIGLHKWMCCSAEAIQASFWPPCQAGRGRKWLVSLHSPVCKRRSG